MGSIAKTIIASGLMIIAVMVTQPLETIVAVKLSHILRIIIGASMFFITAYVLKSPEISSIRYILNRVFKKSNT